MSDMMTQEEAMNMSNEQAVQILIPMRNKMYDQNGCPISDAVFALDKAIEALSADRPQEDTVSRRYLLAEIDDLADEFSEVDENGLHGERWCGILDSRGIIVNAPSVSDRPQGYYIKGENGEWYCSICKRIDDKYSVARFCWHCGARMKGADDE